jgi:putative membrane protein
MAGDPAQKGNPTTAPETSTKGSAAATGFITKAAEGGKAEVDLGNLASSKASSPDVKSFAQMMVTDHTKANDELMSIAKTKNVTLSTDLNSKDKSTRDKLDKLSGAAFDKAYMADMVKDHQADVKEFETASQSTDPDVKAFASKTLPTLRHHLEEAQRISKQVASGAAASSMGASPSTSTTERPKDTTKSSGDAGKDK